jgi:adenylate kinase
LDCESAVKVVFIGGIHGVGKSTLCERLARDHIVLHVKASQLLRDASSVAGVPRQKAVKDVASNQALLVARFADVLAGCSAKTILLDGHFALKELDGTTEQIPVEVFAALRVSSIICLQDSPVAIAARLQARDGSAPTEADLAAFQDAELKHASDVSRALGVRIEVIDAFARDADSVVSMHF